MEPDDEIIMPDFFYVDPNVDVTALLSTGQWYEDGSEEVDGVEKRIFRRITGS